MSESIDTVFVSAISTIKALSSRPGSGGLSRPPPENRARLYGLYKQATEGDIKGLLPRPTGSMPEDEASRNKWDAWKRQEGISKTEAKRRYIELLIGTMKTHASGTTEARQKLMELEDSWIRVKGTISPSALSSVSYGPPYGQYNQPVTSSAKSVRSLGSRRGQGPRATLSEFGLSAYSDKGPEDQREDFDETGPERLDEIRNWKRDVTWALETVNEEIHAIRQRYLNAPFSATTPPNILPLNNTSSPLPSKDNRLNNQETFTRGLLYSAIKHVAIDAAIVVLAVNIVKWLRKRPKRVNPALAKLVDSISGGVSLVLGLLGVNASIR